jgi:hypothetical protein
MEDRQRIVEGAADGAAASPDDLYGVKIDPAR